MKIRTNKDSDFLASGNEKTCALKRLVVDILEFYKISTTHKNWQYSIKEWDNEAAPDVQYTVIVELGQELAMAIKAMYISPSPDITEHGEEQRKVWEFILHEIGLGGIDSLYSEAKKRHINQHEQFMFNVNQRDKRQITPVDPLSLKQNQHIRFIDKEGQEQQGFIRVLNHSIDTALVWDNNVMTTKQHTVPFDHIIEIMPDLTSDQTSKTREASELRDQLAKRNYTIEDFEEGDRIVWDIGGGRTFSGKVLIVTKKPFGKLHVTDSDNMGHTITPDQVKLVYGKNATYEDGTPQPKVASSYFNSIPSADQTVKDGIKLGHNRYLQFLRCMPGWAKDLDALEEKMRGDLAKHGTITSTTPDYVYWTDFTGNKHEGKIVGTSDFTSGELIVSCADGKIRRADYQKVSTIKPTDKE